MNFRNGQKVRVVCGKNHAFKVGSIVTVLDKDSGFIDCLGVYQHGPLTQGLTKRQIKPIFTEYYEKLQKKSKS